MKLPEINNLILTPINEDIVKVHQIKTPFYFSCCDGLLILPKQGRNKRTIILDANIEPKYIKLLNSYYGPVSDYVCSHGHMDHIAHVHAWEDLDVNIHAPYPESQNLLDLENFYECYRFDSVMDFSVIEKFGKKNRYQNFNNVNTFNPGDSLEFEEVTIETLPFPGHSNSHVGFLLPEERLMHLSCLGFDKPSPEKEGFGPWYGFEECSIDQYLKDINYAESMAKQWADVITSSHSYIIKGQEENPFEYMRNKIRQNENKVIEAIKNLESKNKELNIKNLLNMDLFFPKKKMGGFIIKIYAFWEFWIIKNHLKRLHTSKPRVS